MSRTYVPTRLPCPCCLCLLCSAITLRLRSEAARKALAGDLQLQPLSSRVQLGDLPPQKLRRPVESKRKGSAKTDVFTCDALEQALVDYLGRFSGAARP